MTIESTTNRIAYTGSGGTGPFDIPFYFLADADLLVIKTTIADGTEEVLDLTTDYTLTGAGDPDGGTLTLVSSISSSYRLTIIRDPDLLQPADYTESDAFPAETHEMGLDRLTMIAQRLSERNDRMLRQPDGDSADIAELPAKVTRAGYFLAFDTDGDPIAAAGTSGGVPVSAFMATVLDDTTAAAARATLDVPSNAEAILQSLIDAKGDLVVGTADNTAARKAVGSNGRILVADSTQSDGLIWTDFSKDPLNVNPNLLIDQINEGALYTVSSAGTTQGPDGWSGVVSVSGGVFKIRQVADPDNAAKKCLEITCTTADAAVGATDLAYLFTDIEGYDTSSLSPGTASAGSVTLMIESRSLPAGVYGIRVTNSAGNRAYVGTFTTSGAASWQQHSVTLTLDTTGTWLYTNGTGARVQICLMAGANYQGSTGSWGATTNFSTASQVNFLSSTSNIGYLRMHVIPGNVVCAYKPADIQRELAKAQRYYEKIIGANAAGADWYTSAGSNEGGLFNWGFNTTKRATPSCGEIGTFTTSNVTGTRSIFQHVTGARIAQSSAAAGRAYWTSDSASGFYANARLS